MKIRLGTRKSNLAVLQTQLVAQMIRDHYPEIEVEIVKISTKGDEVLHKAIKDVGTKGVFVKEIERALLDGEIDLAVHSMKDMPGDTTPGLCFVDPPRAADPRDVLITKNNKPLRKDGAHKIGTGSLRRALQLKKLYPNCQTVPIRGNIETRMGKIEKENLDGVVLAYAGLIRAGYQDRVQHIFSEDELIPAPCQGILALQIRQEDQKMKDLLKPLAHEKTKFHYQTQRQFQKSLDGGCQTPMGICSRIDHDRIYLKACFGNEEGTVFVEKDLEGPLKDRMDLAEKLAQDLKEAVDDQRKC